MADELFGFDEFEEILERAGNNFKPEVKVSKWADEVVTKVKMKTPVKSGDLKRNIQRDDIRKTGDEYSCNIGGNKKYLEPIEKGWVNKSGGFIQGYHMIESSIEEFNRELPRKLDNWFEELLRELRL